MQKIVVLQTPNSSKVGQLFNASERISYADKDSEGELLTFGTRLLPEKP
jgi:hypothetical protein